jgi:hypothetical protein
MKEWGSFSCGGVMATIATHGVHEGPHELSAGMAMRFAWWSWLVLLLAPFVLFIFVAYRLMDETGVARNQPMANAWFIGTMIYLIIAAPLSFFWRSRLFRQYWKGKVVAPRAYLIGMISVWLVLEIGGIASMVGCLMSNSILPGMLPGVAAFMFFLPLWPSGHAMTSLNVGNAEDPERYKEPG